MRQMEIMAPAGGQPQLEAAVRAGADAVYLGAGAFNARRGAANFGGDSLREAVSYCHARGARVYVTLNTLVTDGETAALLQEMETIAASGCDAVIVQDLGVARMLRECCPSLPLHASTQMSIHSIQGVRALEELGFSRVVLARELTAQEIRAIKDASSLELELFVHGALCMSVSGQCYLSSMLGGRSGNRGMCAQPCRLDFTSGGRHYALSLKDLSLVDRLDQLADCGVTALKIEGRLKRPEYVAAAVRACRQALAGEAPDLDALRAVFSRNGFTDGYFTGKRDVTMFGMRSKEDVAATAGVLPSLEALYRQETPRVPVAMTFTMAPGQPVALEVRDGARTVAVQGDPPQIAQNRPTDEALVRRGLEKTGGTPFFLEELRADLAPGLMVPISALNALRKDALDQLLAQREQVTPHPFHRADVYEHHPKLLNIKIPELRVRLESPRQLSDLLEERAARIILPAQALDRDPALLERLGERAVAELPLLVFPGQEEALEAQLVRLKGRGLSTVLAGNLGTLRLGKRLGFRVLGDYSLNILGSNALKSYAQYGLAEATLSFEINLRQAAALGDYLPYGVIGYGHLPLMTLRNCPARQEKGCGSCPGLNRITDRRGEDFPVQCRDRVYSQLLNPIPLWIGDRQAALDGCSFVTLRFTTEDRERCTDLTRRFLAGEPFPPGEQRTGGLYFRELL